MSSASVGTHHSGAGPLSLMSCVRESSPLQDYEVDGEKNVATKKKFWNPKKWFKRKNKESEHVALPVESNDKDVLRSRSTSELSITEEHTRRSRSGSSMHPGLSVSHDSVFHSPNSGSDMELDQAQSSSSLSISQPQIDLRLQTELSERLRLRRGRGDTSEDDEGLPHSPCNSPTTADPLLLDRTAIIKDLPTKSHSTCSDGSLLSMDSSEMDEESFGQQSRHSSKLSLHEKKIPDQDYDLELGPTSSIAPLNHSAAHHRVAVRPKRRAPHRSKRAPQLITTSALPTTPEVNEDLSARSMTPEVVSREPVTELYSMSATAILTETQLKCSSLPPGLAGPTEADAGQLNRSRSNAGSKSQDHFSTLEEDAEREEKVDKSFFDRIFPRRSAKKRKSKEEKTEKKEEKVAVSAINSVVTQTVHSSSRQTIESSYSTSYSSKRVESKPIAAPRSGAAARQRVQPRDLPASPEALRRDFEILPKPSPEKSAGTSPLQAELESRFKQRQTVSPISNSPPKLSPESPPLSPKTAHGGLSVISAEFVSTTSKHSETRRESRSEEIRSKMKIPGLSSLQQRVLSLNDDDSDDNGFKSLTDFDVKATKPVTKSHSFKNSKPSAVFDYTALTQQCDNKSPAAVAKAASLDCVKHLDEPVTKQQEQFESYEFVGETNDDDKCKSEDKDEEITIVPPSLLTVEDLGFTEGDGITISGPSHTAVVNISSNTSTYNVSNAKTETNQDHSKEVTTKESVSVTKIQLKRESTQITQSTVTVPKSIVPEFLSRQLNKVETKPSSNVVFSMNAPRIVDEQIRPKTIIEQEVKPVARKFSQEDLEIVEKIDQSKVLPLVTITSMTQPMPTRFKKNENGKGRKSSITSTTPESPKRDMLRSRSVSLDSLKNETESSDKSSQDSLDNLDEKSVKVSTGAESVVLRKKSLIRQKADEEPELMKVFARRSLKLKDNDGEQISQQINSMIQGEDPAKTKDSSDKENQAESPIERKKSITKEFIKLKQPLTETKVVGDEPPTPLPESNKNNKESTAEITLRKPITGNLFGNPYQRAISLGTGKAMSDDTGKIKKQPSFTERRKTTENWIRNGTDGGDAMERKISQDEIITAISQKSDFISEEFLTETKNFNQRKAEWEKRAREAQKKTVP